MSRFIHFSLSHAAPCLVILLALRAATFYGDEVDGFTEPYRDVNVAASEMGRIIGLDVCEGERVTTGQVLARLDDDVLKATVEVARANMQSAGRLEAAEAELRLQQETLEKLKELQQRIMRRSARWTAPNSARNGRSSVERGPRGTKGKDARVRTLSNAIGTASHRFADRRFGDAALQR